MSNSPQPQPKPSLTFPPSSRKFLEPYLPSTPTSTSALSPHPFLTLTFATSLDSSLSLSPGTQTLLSGPLTKSLTHYLRSEHDAILVGAGTAVADNPALNCRIEGVGVEKQPRPVILDPRARWKVVDANGEVAECVRLAREGRGKGPWVFVDKARGSVREEWRNMLEGCGGCYVELQAEESGELSWLGILDALAKKGVSSLMVEGGAMVINTLLQERYFNLVDSVIVTIAPVWLGQGGVVVSPPRNTGADGKPKAAARLKQVKWQQFGDDVVMCGRIKETTVS